MSEHNYQILTQSIALFSESYLFFLAYFLKEKVKGSQPERKADNH
jgi:hypothetical protein